MNYKNLLKAIGVSFLFLTFIIMPSGQKVIGSQDSNDCLYPDFIPVRDFFEPYGASVAWDNKNREALIEWEDSIVKIPLQSSSVYINNKAIYIDKPNQLIDQRLKMAPSSLAVLMAEIERENLGQTTIADIERLWNKTAAIHLKDKLWLDENIYDAGHYLMVPLHAAFILDNNRWQTDFSEHFNEFMKHTNDIAPAKLDQLHYYYLLSRFMVLADNADKEELIPRGMADYLYLKTINYFYEEPAWQWERKDFSCIKERVLWRLATQDPKFSYYRAIIDEELFIFAIAADLSNYFHDKDKHRTEKLDDILRVAHEVYTQEVRIKSDGSWLFQPGVWAQHPDYAYAGNDRKSLDLEKKMVRDIAIDTSHSHRFPLWLTSLAEAYPPNSDERIYYEKLKLGLAKQFVDNVLIKPTEDFPAYRTNNFMDGRNGVYRWNYVTQGVNNGYGPYELSGTLMLGWWAFLGNPEITRMYQETANQFPLPDDVIVLYEGPGTSRARHYLISGSNKHVNGYSELISRLASEIYVQ